jgi:cytochrome c biogenesis protein CcdA/PKD repeat protein/thiol-disulfide isomerase/thioredoxin
MSLSSSKPYREPKAWRHLRHLTPWSLPALVLLLAISIGTCATVFGLSLAPEFALTDIDGNTFSLSDFHGRVVMVEFFTSWCGRCIDEIPHLKEVQNEYDSKLEILSISVEDDDTNTILRQFRDQYQIPWIVAKDTAGLRSRYNITAYPTLYIIDSEGYIRYHHIGKVEASTLIHEIDQFISYDVTPPSADAGLDQVVNEDTLVTLDGSASTDNVGVTSYTWTFHDETLQTLIGVQPTYVFQTPANYIVTLNVTDAMGNADTDTVVIAVNDVTPPTAIAGSGQTLHEGSQALFDGSASTDNVGVTSYTWTFHDETLQTLTGVSAKHTFQTRGNYTVSLNVTDATGNWATDAVVITVLPTSEPIANAGPDQVVDEDTLVTLDGSASWNEQGSMTYTWTFHDETLQTLTGQTATYTFSTPDHYIITLTVADTQKQLAVDTVEITVHDVTEPSPVIMIESQAIVGTPIAASAAASTDNVGITEYTWDFGDGYTATSINTTHSYLTPGNYTVVLTVSDAAGLTNTESRIVTVQSLELIPVNIDNQTVYITVQTNSNLSAVKYTQQEATLSFNVEGETDTQGSCNVTLPRVFNSKGLSVYIDHAPLPYQQTQNDTCTTLHFTYTHSAHTITITQNSQPNPSGQLFSCAGRIGLPLFPYELSSWFGPLGNPLILIGSAVLSVLLWKRQLASTTVVSQRKTYVVVALVGGLITVLLGASYFSALGGAGSSDNPSMAPNFSLTDIEDSPFTLSEFRDKMVIIDFMSPMCLGCREQIPHLIELWSNQSIQDQLVIITINMDPSITLDTFQTFHDEFPEATWIWAMDTPEAQVAQAYEVTILPQLSIVDQQGTIAFTHSGVIPASAIYDEITPLMHSDLPVDPSAGNTINLTGLPLIFVAGMLALLSPCGFPMLPGYISYYMGSRTSFKRTVTGGVACSFGLMTVFSVIGIGVALVGSVITQYIPLLELVAGILAIIMGISLLTEIKFPSIFTITRAPNQKGLLGIFLYGIAYGLATLGCSAPIFFSTLFYAITAGGLAAGIVTFLVYAAGMGIPIILTTILLAKTKDYLLNRIIRAMPWFQKISSLLLIVIGSYLILYTLIL